MQQFNDDKEYLLLLTIDCNSYYVLIISTRSLERSDITFIVDNRHDYIKHINIVSSCFAYCCTLVFNNLVEFTVSHIEPYSEIINASDFIYINDDKIRSLIHNTQYNIIQPNICRKTLHQLKLFIDQSGCFTKTIVFYDRIFNSIQNNVYVLTLFKYENECNSLLVLSSSQLCLAVEVTKLLDRSDLQTSKFGFLINLSEANYTVMNSNNNFKVSVQDTIDSSGQLLFVYDDMLMNVTNSATLLSNKLDADGNLASNHDVAISVLNNCQIETTLSTLVDDIHSNYDLALKSKLKMNDDYNLDFTETTSPLSNSIKMLLMTDRNLTDDSPNPNIANKLLCETINDNDNAVDGDSLSFDLNEYTGEVSEFSVTKKTDKDVIIVDSCATTSAAGYNDNETVDQTTLTSNDQLNRYIYKDLNNYDFLLSKSFEEFLGQVVFDTAVSTPVPSKNYNHKKKRRISDWKYWKEKLIR